MAIGRITGPMLVRNLERQGVDLAVEGNLIYFNVTERFIGVNTDIPKYYLDVNGNVFAGNTLTVGYEGNALYRLPTNTAPNIGSIIVAGNIFNTPHDVIWSNVLIIDQEKRFVGVDTDPEYKLDVAGNIFAGDGLIVGNSNVALYQLPNVAFSNVGSILVTGNVGTLDTFWTNVLTINHELRLVGVDNDPEYKLDVAGNIFAGDGLIVGNSNVAIYQLPNVAFSNVGSILVTGNVGTLDTFWSNVLTINHELRLVGVDNDPEYKFDVAGNIFAGDGLIVGNSNVAIYQLPNVAFSNVGSILVTGNVGTLDTFWSNVLTINHELRLVGVDNDPEYKLDVAGNIFAGDGLIVGNSNVALYHLPNVSAPNVGSILIAGNISNSPHDTIWSNIIQIDQERRFVGIDKAPEYKLDIDGNLHVETDANIDNKLWVGQLVTVGNLYTLPTTTPTKNSYLMARGGTLSETVWVPGPDEIFLRRRRYCKVIESLPGYGQVEFVMNLGVTNIVYEFTVSRPVKVEVFSTPSKNEPNPYTFIGTPDHLVDDGSVYLNDGSSYQSRQYSIFANLEDPPKNSFYVTVTSIDQHLASLPVIITLWYYPALLDNSSSGIRFGLTFPTTLVEGGNFFFKIDTKQLYIFYDGTWTPV